MDPKVSVVIPAFNAEEFITETIDSVLAQTYRDYEIIVVDDGSVDNTAELVRQFGNPVRYIKTENRGPSHARNVGIREAQGQYVAFLDADDLWTPDKLAIQVEFLSKRPDIDFVFADMLKFSKDQITMPSYFKLLKNSPVNIQIPNYEDCLDDPTRLLLKCNVVPTGTVMVRKDCLERTDLFDEKISNVEDLDLWIRLSLVCRFGCIPRVLKKKRDHQGNISKNRLRALKAALYMCAKLTRDFPQFTDVYRKEHTRRICRHNRTLGYYYFTNNEMKHARPHLWRSLCYQPTTSSVVLFCASFFPLCIIEKIRIIKAFGKKRLNPNLKGDELN